MPFWKNTNRTGISSGYKIKYPTDLPWLYFGAAGLAGYLTYLLGLSPAMAGTAGRREERNCL